MENVVIVGYGTVGQGMQKIFPDAVIYDPPKGLGQDNCKISQCELSIICVPTPQSFNGSCDVSQVEYAVAQAETPLILIKSTVSPGTTERLRKTTHKRIVFSPEYMGESEYWTPAAYPSPFNPVTHGFMILGGSPQDCADIADLFLPRLGPATRFRFMTSTEAEIVKYAENAFFALKVTFANELRAICNAADVSYHSVREGWLDDPRVGPMHTAAFRDAPGFDGKCFPKDISALITYCESIGVGSTLLQAIVERNRELRQGP
ncbi:MULTISPECIES: UDP-glucose/GDP-mannose dehydrogenase family protein [unclassified Pseudomonas]|uniref:UDP-glucose/GDP-mannose dehydrogenase family protein n=1 Tax=unclassified Pseudomonas TaxID=196821 RepID=UPI0015B710D3|nr:MULTISPECIES: UDP-glucose/GDP-mannose dehydrogenase family protein [unclassified Pseudomonas]